MGHWLCYFVYPLSLQRQMNFRACWCFVLQSSCRNVLSSPSPEGSITHSYIPFSRLLTTVNFHYFANICNYGFFSCVALCLYHLLMLAYYVCWIPREAYTCKPHDNRWHIYADLYSAFRKCFLLFEFVCIHVFTFVVRLMIVGLRRVWANKNCWRRPQWSPVRNQLFFSPYSSFYSDEHQATYLQQGGWIRGWGAWLSFKKKRSHGFLRHCLIGMLYDEQWSRFCRNVRTW